MFPTRGVIYQTDRKGVLELCYQCGAIPHWDQARICSVNAKGSQACAPFPIIDVQIVNDALVSNNGVIYRNDRKGVI